MAVVSPTGTGKTLSYLLPIFAALKAPLASLADGPEAGLGVRALIIAPTNELALQIYNECLKLARGRKWGIVLFNKANASTLADKEVRKKKGKPLGSRLDQLPFILYIFLNRHYRWHPFATNHCVASVATRIRQVSG